jgi:hypothetical protein
MISSVLVGVHNDTERRHIVTEGMELWVKDHPPPPGVEMRGWYPITRYVQPRPGAKGAREKEPEQTREERARQRWLGDWSGKMNELQARSEDARAERGHTDWRPTLSFANNLDRLGDALLDSDSAWVLLGRTLERPRQMMEITRGRGSAVQTETINERRLADRRVWQFPWYWSAGVLAGVCLLSALVLSRRIKSLDRLK